MRRNAWLNSGVRTFLFLRRGAAVMYPHWTRQQINRAALYELSVWYEEKAGRAFRLYEERKP